MRARNFSKSFTSEENTAREKKEARTAEELKELGLNLIRPMPRREK